MKLSIRETHYLSIKLICERRSNLTTSHLLKFDSPIHNLQVFLRTISRKYPEIPNVIPDGVYGDATVKAVEAFQQKFMSESDGIVGFDTWDKIVDVYKGIETENENKSVTIFPEQGVLSQDELMTSTVYIIQSMLLALSDVFSNIPRVNVTGYLDTSTVEGIKAIQYASGLNPDGNITNIFWNYLSSIYEVFISKDRVGNNTLLNYVTQV